jgi:hypothetical protein
VIWAAWVTAAAAVAGTVLNAWQGRRHAREDDKRFADVHERLNGRDG